MTKRDVLTLQRDLNAFTKKYLPGLPALDVDGEKGPSTNRRIMTAKYYLGYGKNRDGSVKPAFLARLRSPHDPRRFTPRMYATSFARRRKYRGHGGGEGPDAAIRWCEAQYRARVKESPAGSNRGPRITDWQRKLGSWLVGQPWCGVFCGTANIVAGVKGITSRVAAVAFIEDDAKAGRNGYRSWHGPRGGQRGDDIVLFGRGVHVEKIAEVHPWGYITYGGNTSYEGAGGSQSNGGCVARRKRPFDQVRGCARPAY